MGLTPLSVLSSSISNTLKSTQKRAHQMRTKRSTQAHSPLRLASNIGLMTVLSTFTALTALTAFIAPMAQAQTLQLSSPDSHIMVLLSDDNRQPHYQVSFHGETVIDSSRLGLVFKQLGELGQGFTLKSHKTSSHDSQWQQPWGERETIYDKHHALSAIFSNGALSFEVEFKAFDDGIGFRYRVPKQACLKGVAQLDITNELSEFSVLDAKHATAWWIPGRGWNRYEYLYNTTSLDKVDRAHTPFTFKTVKGTHISIHEAALIDYAAMVLNQGRDGKLKADLTPWSDGILVKTAPGFTTPWRTIQIADSATGLLNSDLILNLNEPNKLGDVSWVKPGKYVGIWWGMHLGENTWGSGPKHGATSSETQRYMDFAAEYGFDGVLVEGWNEGWDGSWYENGDVFSFTKAYEDFDLAKVTAYGAAKNVRLVGHHETSGSVTNYRNQMSAAYDLYKKHGVTQVKTGYVADGAQIKRVDEQGIVRHEWHDGQFMVNEYLHSVTEAAKRGISINTHEPIKDTGLRRTYPNWIAREGARGQEYNAWGTPPNNPEHTAILPFTRMLAGPMDFTPGIFNLAPEGLDAVNRVQTTLTKQLALYVVLYSPIQMAADLPRNYVQRLDAFQFIRDVPTDWRQSIALAGEVGDFVAIARQAKANDEWFIGALSDENSRELRLTLDFLDKDRTYQAQIYRDGPKAHWLTNPYDYVIETKTLTAKDSLTLTLAASGGVAIRLLPL
ncbi:alpha-glucosidase [Shewanella denitrificans OS217]|uniref:Alpha-glucosidase n=2 Tax=Shewanella TaxID=22 RepID=Q12MP1_SHEDO|nr:alpha-glucosidase [Shewanella denitrificans OS217]